MAFLIVFKYFSRTRMVNGTAMSLAELGQKFHSFLNCCFIILQVTMMLDLMTVGSCAESIFIERCTH